MSQYDCPDYEYITTIVVGGTVTDCPDWQQQLTGPGGGVIPGITSGVDWSPGDFNLAGWSFPPWSLVSTDTTTINTGVLNMWPIKITATQNITQLGFVWLGGTTAWTAHENYIGLYSASYTSNIPNTFTLICSSASGALETNLIASASNGGGFIFTTIPTTAVTAGQVLYVGFLGTWTGAATPQYQGIGQYVFSIPSNSTTYKAITGAEWFGPYTTLPSSLAYASATNQVWPVAMAGVY